MTFIKKKITHTAAIGEDSGGFTIIELVVSVAIFALLSIAVLGVFAALSKSVKAAREKTALASLATNYLEIVKNMPYSQVGTLNGNPHGSLPDLTNAVNQKIEAYSYKIYYEVSYIDDPADGTILLGTDSAANDYKQVKMDILNTGTGQVTSFVTTVVPKGLEGLNNAGALLIKVFNAQGQPIVGANVHITYPTTSPTIILDRITDTSGQVIEVGLPAAVNNYRISASSTGYSMDQTYQVTGTNPNPTKPDATILNGQVTQVSLSIDQVSNLTLKTLNEICQPLNSVNINVKGAKKIGTSPDVFKFNQNFSSASGVVTLSGVEWDNYTPILLTGQSVIVKGTSPIQKIDVLPGTSQTYTMILGSNTIAGRGSFLVIVKDSATGTALENASVTLSQGATTYGPVFTGGSVWVQNDWSGASAQTDWNNTFPTRYFQTDGNVDTTSGQIKLKKVGADYPFPGWLESSTFDTGTSATNFTTLNWQPLSQTASTTLQFQIATNNDNATWNYVGPDGTAATYYSTPGSSMSSVHDNNRYVRYKVFLSNTSTDVSPTLSSVSVNFVTGCFTPGQVWFSDLPFATNYSLVVSLPGYTTQTINNLNIGGDNVKEVLMSP